MSVTLWVEDFRPKTLEEYVWRDPAQRKIVEEWIAAGAIPHVMFSGKTGTGKTSLAELILILMGIPNGDILKINASRERKIEDIQERILSFVSTWALGPTGIKYVLLDEADSMSPLAQRVLRGEMETYHETCRFIFTCNYPEKIIPAIHGRCQGFHFEALDRDDYTARAGEILVRKDVKFELDVLLSYVEATYPDLRKCINLLQQNSSGGELAVLPKEDTGTKDYLFEVANLFRSGRYLEARKMIVAQAQVEEYPDIYRFFYTNLDMWGKTQTQQDEALLIIRQGLINHAIIADAELNLSATMVQLSRVSE